ncbi:amidase family protein [Cribrihabitans pelagius]|uniref:amidase family protein n=1 Tax=Cribrihabitans pelagius TaxID=1765746 RepID=UPI003B5B0003
MSELTRLSALEMATRLRAGTLSTRALLDAHRARTEEVNGGINAFITLGWAAAGAHADELDAMAARGSFAGPLHGLPVAVKDIFETRGLRTTWGSRSFEHHVPGFDALHVARLRTAACRRTGAP